MCELPALVRFAEYELSEINRRCGALPGDWTVFPHVDSEGEITLLLTPARWEDEDAAMVLQRDPGGIVVLLSEGDTVTLQGSAPDAATAMDMVWKCACRRSPVLAELNWAAGA